MTAMTSFDKLAGRRSLAAYLISFLKSNKLDSGIHKSEFRVLIISV
jgi:hypothetical protein